MYEEISENINPALEILANNWQLFVAGYLLIALIGIILGYKQKIVVFENFDDLALSLGLVVFPIALSFLASVDPSFIKGPIGIAFFIIEFVILSIIISKTWRSNDGFLGFLLAFLTKIPFAIIYGFSLLNAIAPTGKTFGERSARRQNSIAGLLLLTPLLIKLVKYKKGVWIPKNMPVSALRGVNFEEDEEIENIENNNSLKSAVQNEYTNLKYEVLYELSLKQLQKIAVKYNINFSEDERLDETTQKAKLTAHIGMKDWTGYSLVDSKFCMI